MRTLISYSDFSHTASIHPTLEGKGRRWVGAIAAESSRERGAHL